MKSKYLFIAMLISGSAFGQSGDKPGEVQTPPPASLRIPPAPPLSVEEALKTFKVAPGFRVEVAAAEPLVEAPVEIEFAPDGRMYVVEMRGFMPNVDGKGEDQPVGRISILEDRDGDGRMDHSTVFVEGLVMPRALAVLQEGVLVAEPPHLWLYKDIDGDGKADEKIQVASNYGSQENPEHTANALMWGADNWIYSANHTVRYRKTDDGWEQDTTNFRGQWGLTQDDWGRLFFNSNSDQLRADLVPAKYLSRNPNYKGAFGANVQLIRNQAVWPIRVNPGVNRGYQKGQLREDGTLATFTGACGPCIYRGDLFPKTYQGAAFLCEPTGNLVRCNLLSEKEGVLSAENAFDKAEFLASTDERFRPVNIHNGPDGALYIVDMYRGVIQHRIYLTTYLRNQALERQLDTPLNMGRIYRVVPESYQRTQVQKLTELSTIGLVKALESPNGWRRDTAQRLLVERGDARAAEPLKQLVASSSDARARFHALWALEGLGAIDPEVLSEGLKCDHPKVRALAIRLSEPYLQAEGRTPIHDRVLAMKNDPAFDVQLQLIYSLGNVQKPGAEEVFLRLLEQNLEKELARDGAISGMAGRELRILERFVGTSGWKEKTTGREQLVRDLAQCIMVSGKPEAINSVIELAANAKSQWQQTALLDGMLAAVPPRQRNRPAQPIKPVVLPKEPTALASLLALKDKAIEERLERLDELIVWKGKKGYEVAEVQPLTKEEQELFEAGRTLYVTICGACHQPNGQGLEGLAPPLVDSEWVTGSEERLTRLVLQGVRGPITVNGKVWNMDMPPLNILDDAQLAAVMTFIRREWGHTAPPIKEDTVKRIREATIDREEAWTEAELLKIP